MSDKAIIQLFKFIGYTLLLIIGLGTAQKFPQWFAPYLLANPILVLPIFLLIIGGLLAFNKRLRKVFVNICRELYKNSLFLRVLIPKNKLTRFVFYIGFVFVWLAVWGFIIDASIPKYPNGDTRGYSQEEDLIIAICVLVPIFFITPFFWLEDVLNIFKKFKDIPNTFINGKKETTRRIKSTIKYLSKSNISDADELKKYADLRDQGIITEKEFQAKKKKLLDL